MARREFKGAAVPTRLLAGIGAGDTSFGLVSNAGWPTGGANGPFTVILDPDVPGKEEVVLVNNQSAGNCTTVTRGVGDTTAVAHAVGSDGSVIHGTCRLDADEANRHINNITDDNHTQYMMTDGTRHDLTARHSAGTVVPTAVPVAIGTGLAEGAGTTLARSTHVHTIGVGAINLNTMFAAGVIGPGKLAAGAIDSAGMFAAGIVNAAALGADSVGSSELAPAAIDDITLFGSNLRPTIVAATNPGAVGAGVMWINTTKRATLIRDAANTGWEVMNAWGPSIPYTPTLTNFTVGAGANEARYRRHGSTIIADGFIQFGPGATTNANLFTIGLPVAAADYSSTMGSFYYHGAARGTDTPNANWAGVGLVLSGDSPGAPFTRTGITAIATGGQIGWNNTVPFTWDGSANDSFSWFVEYEPATYSDANYV
jgi:hypothetical protein